MRVLVACEESQEVCKAFRALGHEAYSCDIEPCSGGHPEWHLQVDALELLKLKWDLIIAHPPCTYLSKAGGNRLRINGEIQEKRFEKGRLAKDFFMEFYNADCPKIAVENPIPLKIFGLPLYSQIIQPYMFGDPWMKTTCLWLKGLPILMADDIVVPEYKWVNSTDHRKNKKNGYMANSGSEVAKRKIKNGAWDCPCDGSTMGWYL